MTAPSARPADPRPADPRPADPRPADPRPADASVRVRAAVACLDGLDERPLTEHVAVFEEVHAALGVALAAGAADPGRA
jgi:hypothetical protein